MAEQYETYLKEFEKTVKDVKALEKKIQKATSISELNQLEKEASQALMYVQHTSMRLGYFIQGSATKRRSELNSQIVDEIRQV